MQVVVQNDRPIAQVAKELQINSGTLGNWVKLYREQNPRAKTGAEPLRPDTARRVESRGP